MKDGDGMADKGRRFFLSRGAFVAAAGAAAAATAGAPAQAALGAALGAKAEAPVAALRSLRVRLPAPAADPAESVEAEEWESDSADRLHDALGRLDERSRDILEQRWIGEDKATLHELAGKYGVSAERIRQIESNALTKLRTLMAPATA